MTKTSVVDLIRKLVELQAVDAQYYGFKKELEEKPVYLADLKEKFESKKANLKALEDKYKNLLVARNSLEVDLKSQDDAIAKSNMQLSQLKTNKEYTAKMTEIESIKADQSQVEEKILLSYDETDAVKSLIDKEKQILAEEEKNFSVEKKVIDDAMREMQDKMKVLESQRNTILPGIEKSYFDRYQRILVNKHGLAIVPVQGNVCGGCFMNVPAQVINEMKMHDKIIFCEMCARILYLKEDVEKD